MLGNLKQTKKTQKYILKKENKMICPKSKIGLWMLWYIKFAAELSARLVLFNAHRNTNKVHNSILIYEPMSC